jgi:transcriptional regulator NrdR family protein
MSMAAPSRPLWNRGNEPGVECPNCGCPESEVVETRRRVLKVNGKLAGGIVRRRECEHCGYRFTTNERVRED